MKTKKYFDKDTKRKIILIGKEKSGYQKVRYLDGEEYKLNIDNIGEYIIKWKKNIL